MYLVTGGAGFIGSHTVARLLAAGHAVRVLDDLSTGRKARLDLDRVDFVQGSITDPLAVDVAMKGVERVIHLAARVSVPESIRDPAGFHEVNVSGFLHVLEAARRVGVKGLAYASSCAVYGDLPGDPKAETDPLSPGSPYAASKLANEAYGASWKALGVPCVGLRYFNVFGERQDPHGAYGAVIPTFVSRALKGQVLQVHGDGSQGRDFVSVHDVAAANVAAAQRSECAGEVFNVGTGTMLTVRTLAERVVDVVGQGSVTFTEARPGDIQVSRADVRHARERLGWQAAQRFDDALEATIRWFADGMPDS